MKKTTVNVTVFKYGHPAVQQVEGWILKHRLDDTIQLAAVRRSFEEDNQDRWNITELSTGFKVAGNFRTRQEAEQYLETAMQMDNCRWKSFSMPSVKPRKL